MSTSRETFVKNVIAGFGGGYRRISLVVVFLNGNQDHIPIEPPALSPEQALQDVPGRLSNPEARVAALSADKAGSAGEAGVDAVYGKFAGEVGAAGEGAFTPTAASPPGKARPRSLGDERGQRQMFCHFRHVSACSSLVCLFLCEICLFLSFFIFFYFFLHLMVGLHEAMFEGWGCMDFRCWCGVSIFRAHIEMSRRPPPPRSLLFKLPT